MAKQSSPFPIEGTIGNITYYKSGGEYYARTKSSVTKKKIMTNPAYLNTRRAMAEFGMAARASKLLRRAFNSLPIVHNNPALASRLTKLFLGVIRSDDTGEFGHRKVEDGNIDLLKGFEFNESVSLHSRLRVPFTTGINRNTGKVWIDLSSNNHPGKVEGPEWASHFRISLAAAAIDTEKNSSEGQLASTMELPMNGMIDDMKLSLTLTPKSNQVIILAVALEFLQQSAGRFNLVTNAEHAMAIVDTSRC